MKKIHHYVVRFIYVRHVNIFGWPTRRMRSVWWLYEMKYREPRLKVAKALIDLCNALNAGG